MSTIKVTPGGLGESHQRPAYPRQAGEGERDLLDRTVNQDYTDAIVPLEKRNSPLTMALLWISLQASVTIMYAGYLARQQGLSLGDVIWAGVIGFAAVMFYGFGASALGAYTGQTHTLLTRTIFGRIGSGFVSVLLIIMGMGWYGFQAFFLAQILQGLFGWKDITLIAAAFGAVMIFNNIFGFKGVSTYARYLAAPILLLWGLYAVVKGVATVPGHTLFTPAHVPVTTTILILTGLLVGNGMWGNEPDIYRYAKPRLWSNTPALLIGYFVGMFVFPIAGYLMAELSGASAFGPIMKYFVGFSLFGFTALATVVFFINQFSLNDGNLYEAINAMQNLFGWKRIISVLLLGVAGAGLAAMMVSLQNNFFIVAGISAVFVPCATMIMVMDVFIVPRLFGLRRPVDKVTAWHDAASINRVGMIALVIGLVVGSYTGGLIPGIPGFGTTSIGFPALQSWVLSALCYLIGVALVRRSPRCNSLLGYPLSTTATATAAASVAPTGATVQRP